VESDSSKDAFGYTHRSGGDHMIGDSMPATFGDSQRVLHDANGQTPSDSQDIKMPGGERPETGEVETQTEQSVKEMLVHL
jgi:hypothetical protein